jgi:dihydropteroate synthase
VFRAEPDRPAITWQDVAHELADRLAAFPAHVRATAWIDPGLGFGKGADPTTNLDLLRHAGDLEAVLGRPVLVGPSRKRFLRSWRAPAPALPVATMTEAELDDATVAACFEAVSGGAKMVRVHNVALLNTARTAYNHS